MHIYLVTLRCDNEKENILFHQYEDIARHER